MELVGQLFDGVGGVVERQFDVGDEVGVDERFGRTAGNVAADAAEVLGCDGELPGVKGYGVMVAMMGFKERHEVVEQAPAAVDACAAPTLKMATPAAQLAVETKEVALQLQSRLAVEAVGSLPGVGLEQGEHAMRDVENVGLRRVAVGMERLVDGCLYLQTGFAQRLRRVGEHLQLAVCGLFFQGYNVVREEHRHHTLAQREAAEVDTQRGRTFVDAKHSAVAKYAGL